MSARTYRLFLLSQRWRRPLIGSFPIAKLSQLVLDTRWTDPVAKFGFGVRFQIDLDLLPGTGIDADLLCSSDRWGASLSDRSHSTAVSFLAECLVFMLTTTRLHPVGRFASLRRLNRGWIRSSIG